MHAIPKGGNNEKRCRQSWREESRAFFQAKMRRNISPMSTSPARFFCFMTSLCSAGSCWRDQGEHVCTVAQG
uniref:Uncharacterized protein n=1 Tax=Arundo donax TaxID=35708 RepID=A0A0A8Z3C1_ARUDO